jgi:predicted acyl esterase
MDGPDKLGHDDLGRKRMAGLQQRSEIRDGMRIDWNVPIEMDDGLVLRADVFRPIKEGRYPVILTYGPYAKNLSFQEGYPTAWQTMESKHPDVTAGSSNLYQNWEVVDPEKWVPHDYACVRVDSRGAGCSPGVLDHSRRARRKIITTASNGPACSPGPAARSALTASPITA